VTPPAGGSVSQTFTFDGLGRRTSKYLGQLSHWNSVWANNVETMTTPMQDQEVNYIDGRGRIARTTQSPSTESQLSTDAIFSYDGFDARTNILESRRGVQQLFAYDNAHRLTGVSRDGESVTYGGFGITRNATTMKHGTQTTTYGYDAATGRINSVSGIFLALPIPIEFEAGGQRLTRIGDEKYCFNDRGWMEKIGPDCTNPTRSYGFDARGNRISETANLLTRNFTYDSADRLTSATEWNQQLTTYNLNPDGTRNTEISGGVTKTYNYLDGRGGLTNVTWATGIDSYIWDNAGRLKTATTAAGVRTFEFDSRDRVTKVNNINIENDALGMRRRAVDGPSIRTWTYGGEDGESLTAEGADLLTRVNGFAVAQGNTNFTQRDALGSVLKQQQGASNSTATFSAFGKRSGNSLTSIGYTGQPNEGDDLVWTGVRPYMPSTGMFVALDEMGAGNFIGTPSELNPHSYARNNPMRYTDPSGRCSVDDRGRMNCLDAELESTMTAVDVRTDREWNAGNYGEFSRGVAYGLLLRAANIVPRVNQFFWGMPFNAGNDAAAPYARAIETGDWQHFNSAQSIAGFVGIGTMALGAKLPVPNAPTAMGQVGQAAVANGTTMAAAENLRQLASAAAGDSSQLNPMGVLYAGVGGAGFGALFHGLTMRPRGPMSIELSPSEMPELTSAEEYLFRGTTEGYAGRYGVSPTSLSPSVATNFATQSTTMHGGEGVVYVIPRSRAQSIELPPQDNALAYELEIPLDISPAEIAGISVKAVPVSEARRILHSIGHATPERIYSNDSLTTTLKNQESMSADQIRAFLKAIGL
jgi:RHS repeat-associated protein